MGLGLSIGLTPEIAYIWDCRTTPQHRRRGLYRSALRQTLALAQSEGAKLAIMVAECDNETSRGGILTAGFREYATVHLVRLGPALLSRGAGGLRLLLGRAPSLHWRDAFDQLA